MGPLQAPGAGGNLADRQGGRVIDVKRAGFQRLGGFDKAAELGLGHVTAPDLFGRHLGGFGQDPRGQLLGAHFQRKEPDDPAFDRSVGPVGQAAAAVGLGDVEGDVGGQRGLPHRRSPRQDQQVGRMQAAQLLVQVDQPGRDPGQPPVALIGGVGHIHRIRYRLEKALKSALRDTLFAQFVQPLFRLDDLFARFAFDIDLGGAGRNIAPQRDKLAAHGQIIDHLGIVACRKGRNRGPRQTGQIGRPAQLAQPQIIFQKGFQRDRRGQRVLLDARSGNLEDAGVNGVEEMFGPHQRRNAVIDIVVGQDDAQQLLLGFDVMGQDVGFGHHRHGRTDRRHFIHHCCPHVAPGVSPGSAPGSDARSGPVWQSG